MSKFEWFKRFSEVPGITWESPVEVEVDPGWAAAHPVVKTLGDDESSFTSVSWCDLEGNPYSEEFTLGSPAEAAGRAIRESRGVPEILTALSRSLSLPGSRRDYFDAIVRATSVLSRLAEEDPARPAWIETLAYLAVSLLRTGVEATLISGERGLARRGQDIALAGQPYGTLIRLYLGEGFLREATVVYEELQQLPNEARAWSQELDPSEARARLRELQSAVEAHQ